VTGTNLDESIIFQGPLVDGDYWPVVTVAHPSGPLHRPPAGTDVGAWYDSHGMQYDSQTVVAGLPALRVSTPGGPGSYGTDLFAFIHEEQLYSVGFLHTGGREDWALYDQFLAGMTFP
jgi:hypothetical protein